jgi:hypothetical protein
VPYDTPSANGQALALLPDHAATGSGEADSGGPGVLIARYFPDQLLLGRLENAIEIIPAYAPRVRRAA